MRKNKKHAHNHINMDNILIVKLYKSGLSMKKIGDKLNVSSATICDRLKEHNISRVQGFRKGNKNPSWKGGISKLKGICLYCEKNIETVSKGRKKVLFCDTKCNGLYRKGKSMAPQYRRRKRKVFDEAEMVKLYKSGLNLIQVAKIFNVSTDTINTRLNEHNITKRKPFGGVGKDHYNWKNGGKSKLYQLIYGTREYRIWRKSVFERDNYVCQECSTPGYIQAHHIKLFNAILKKYEISSVDQALKCKELWDIDNGITLCIDCHKDKHRKVEKVVEMITNDKEI